MQRRYNWDAAGSRAISRGACREALEFVRAAVEKLPQAPLPRVYPASIGAVALYWKRGNEHLTVNVPMAGRPLSVQHRVSGQAGREEPSSVSEAIEKLREMYG